MKHPDSVGTFNEQHERYSCTSHYLLAVHPSQAAESVAEASICIVMNRSQDGMNAKSASS